MWCALFVKQLYFLILNLLFGVFNTPNTHQMPSVVVFLFSFSLPGTLSHSHSLSLCVSLSSNFSFTQSTQPSIHNGWKFWWMAHDYINIYTKLISINHNIKRIKRRTQKQNRWVNKIEWMSKSFHGILSTKFERKVERMLSAWHYTFSWQIFQARLRFMPVKLI